MVRLFIYDPEHPWTSAIRSLASYVANTFDPDIVEVQQGYPDLTKITRDVPLAKTIVHIDLADATPSLVGFGTPGDELYDALNQEVIYRIADARYDLHFDIGIWASQETGGATSRMEVHEALSRLLVGAVADTEMAQSTNGLHLVLPGLSGGRYLLDSYNDVPVWRAADLVLQLRVFARRVPLPVPSIESVTVDLVTTITP